MERLLATSLAEVAKNRDLDPFQIHHVPYFAHRLYIEAPGIHEIQEVLKFSTCSHLAFRGVRVFDDTKRSWL